MAYKWLVLITVAIGNFMASLDASIVNISFPILAKIFHTDASVVLWVSVAYLLLTVGLMLILGKMADIVSQKKMYVVGLATFTLGLALCTVSQSIIHLILSRLAQGIGAAMIIALSMAIVTAAFPYNERGKALGMLGAVVSLGLLIGPILGGFFLDLLGWRAIFFLRIPLGFIGFIMALLFLKNEKIGDVRYSFDIWGAASLFCGLSCLILFFNLGGKFGFLSPASLIPAACALTILSFFLVVENRAKQPVVDLTLFKNRTFACGNICTVVLYTSIMGFVFLTPFLLIDGLGFSASQAGLLMSTVPLTNSLVGPITGWISDKVGSKVLRTCGLAVMSIALFFYSRIEMGAATVDMLPRLVLIGLGLGIFDAPNNNSILSSVSGKNLGTASAMINTSRQLGLVVGTAIMGTLFTSRQLIHMGRLSNGIVNQLMLSKLTIISAFKDTLFIASVLSLIGIAISLIAAQKPNNRFLIDN